jgi:hypothetical protein
LRQSEIPLLGRLHRCAALFQFLLIKLHYARHNAVVLWHIRKITLPLMV